MNHRFGKKYKLCSKRIIDRIFESGEIIKEYPLFIRYIENDLPENTLFQVVVSVPKRSFKKAHDRNRIRRICKEAIRLKKNELEDALKTKDKQLALFIIYSAREELGSKLIQDKTQKAISKLLQKINTNEI